MIKVEYTSEQELSKDDFIVKGQYANNVKFCGIQIWKRTSTVNNVLNDQKFKRNVTDGVGFCK